MATKSHPATTRQLAEALGVCRTAASRKVAAAEQLLGVLCEQGGRFAGAHRAHNVRTAMVERIRTLAALIDKRPSDEFDAWLDTYLAEQAREHRRA
jgi:hypothetical protein